MESNPGQLGSEARILTIVLCCPHAQVSFDEESDSGKLIQVKPPIIHFSLVARAIPRANSIKGVPGPQLKCLTSHWPPPRSIQTK